MTDDTDTHGHLVAEDSRITRTGAFLMGVVVGLFVALVLMAIFGGSPDPNGAFVI